ncbi:hypothetical protein BVG16_26680 [Paenibacillus selenitireducens]|uniref:Uncharacterized protein n=1 Tax=Paenibacillus selenitireducens TaxID=1324314 RepID=A0A1T2X1E4_9BACL|nr:hypothetical protein [Paenibacillus selenitireducens]OPA73684.1 hypothetical protein BVG16_26680 [Paenibacillus selenitireducens]
MNHTRLILVEGIPGSGKTSTARYIKDQLDKNGIFNTLFLEGDLNHPADYEFVACLDLDEYEDLKDRYPELIHVIDQYTQVVKQYKLIYYGKLQQLSIETHKNLIDELVRFDVYNVSLDRYQELIVERWLNFVRQVQQSHGTVILECCFLQNPLTLMFGRFNQSKLTITDFIKRLEQIILPLNPKLIYFYQDDIRLTIDRVTNERSNEWLRHLIWYFTEQGYGKENGYHGLDGVCKVLKERKEYELDIINQLKIDKLTINNTESNWKAVLLEISDFLKVSQ